MAEATESTAPFWSRYTDGSGIWRRNQYRPPGEHLAAMRAGAGRDPGTVPGMWELHSEFPDASWRSRHHDAWAVPNRFEAEHHALVLYGFHQQSVGEPMHRTEVSVGTALRQLGRSGRASEAGVVRMLTAAATATSLAELSQHLRRVVTRLRGARIPLDYDRLLDDLSRWQHPDAQGRVRRRWGLDFFVARAGNEQADEGVSTADSTNPERAPSA